MVERVPIPDALARESKYSKIIDELREIEYGSAIKVSLSDYPGLNSSSGVKGNIGRHFTGDVLRSRVDGQSLLIWRVKKP
jgi:hypothetical protein